MSEKKKYRYYVVQFNDEVHLVPRNWLNEDMTKLYWPIFVSNLALERAVSNMVSFQSNWKQFTVKKIITATNNYEKGKWALNLAVKIKDNSLDSEEFESYKKPKRKKPLSKQCFTSSGEWESFDFSPEKCARTSSQQTITLCWSDLKSASDLFNIKRSKENKNCPGFREEELYELYAIISKACSDMNNLGEKIRTIGNTQKAILNKINYLWRLETDNMEACCETLQVHNFPIRTQEALFEVEEKLCDTTYRKLLIQKLRTVGGNDVKSIVEHVMAFLLNDALAAQFICLGMTKKPIFSELRLYLVIADVVTTHEPRATAFEIFNAIEMWLTQEKPERNQETDKNNVETVKRTIEDEVSCYQDNDAYDKNQNNVMDNYDDQNQDENNCKVEGCNQSQNEDEGVVELEPRIF